MSWKKGDPRKYLTCHGTGFVVTYLNYWLPPYAEKDIHPSVLLNVVIRYFKEWSLKGC